jgi:hypothetical protein
MPRALATYLEIGSKRVFAGALDWPGWCRSGRDERAALETLVAYGPRYRAAIGAPARGFRAPTDASSLEVVERVKGDATTDFGAPGAAPAADDRPLEGTELNRHVRLLRASWAAFDAAAEAGSGKPLRKGPRGGGRELDAIVSHVVDAEHAYLSKLGGAYRTPQGAGAGAERDGIRETVVASLRARARGEPPPKAGRSKLWSPRYFVRRASWHVLDHAWEIEDRAGLTTPAR